MEKRHRRYQQYQAFKKEKTVYTLSIVLWALYLSGGYIGFMAFRETEQYGIKEAFTILSAGSIGMIASPGGIGAYAYLIEKTMELYGLNYTIALAFGWILWLAQTLVMILGGLISFVALPFSIKRKTPVNRADLIPQKILTTQQAVQKTAQWRLLGKKISFTNGVFDILHQGHIFSCHRQPKGITWL